MASNRKSPLSKQENQRRNTKGGRAKMADSSFALPEQKKYRLDDIQHARNADVRVAQYGSPSEKARVRAAVHKKYPSIKQKSK